MQQIGVDEGVAEEGPQIGTEAAGETASQSSVITRRNERKSQEKLRVLRFGEDPHAQRMNEQEHGDRRNHDRRHVEDRLVALGHRGNYLRHVEIGRGDRPGKRTPVGSGQPGLGTNWAWDNPTWDKPDLA